MAGRGVGAWRGGRGRGGGLARRHCHSEQTCLSTRHNINHLCAYTKRHSAIECNRFFKYLFNSECKKMPYQYQFNHQDHNQIIVLLENKIFVYRILFSKN